MMHASGDHSSTAQRDAADAPRAQETNMDERISRLSPDRSTGKTRAPAASRSWPTPSDDAAPARARALLLPRATGATSASRPRSRTPGDFKRTVVGERSVIMVRDHDGAIHVVENVCAHRGMQLLPRAPRQPQGLHLPVPPVELHAQGRPAGRAVPPRRQAGRQGQRRHAGRLQAGRPRPDQAEGRDARRRRVRVVRPRRRVARGLPRPDDPAATSTACSTAAS